jgi:hypothetical protein
VAKKFPASPAHPERLCWGCELYCPADSMRCGNGSIRTPHPAELFGEDWLQWANEQAEDATARPGPEGAGEPGRD